jgi:hypothetical protein
MTLGSGALALALLSCASPYRMPSALHNYHYYVVGRDSLSVALETALRRRGLEVMPQLRGGAGPTAAVIHFIFRDPADSLGAVLHVQLADTRTGVVVGDGMALLARLPVAASARAEALLDSVGLRRPAP